MKTGKTEESVGANEETLDKWSEPRYLGGLNPHKKVSSHSIDLDLNRPSSPVILQKRAPLASPRGEEGSLLDPTPV
ncbi:hypothetical protein HanIR_Chr12g0598421 [Helianthus annuus]|nr:hypothetical protein HanIR_Chr12g0598421 [Helianthus annuus]